MSKNLQSNKKNQKINNSVKSNNITDTGKANLKNFKDLPTYVAIIIFFATTLIFFWDIIFGNSFFWEDIVRFVYPLQNFAAKEVANMNIPFWNPYTFSGMPFLADLQVGFFYPLNRILGLFFGSDGNLSFSALQLMIILHFFIAQINTFFLAKSMKMSKIASIIVAIGYSFSLILVTHAIHPMIVHHLSWFPLVVMFFLKGVRFGDIKSGIIAGIILGLSMLSGHTQIALYEGLVLLIIFIWYFVVNYKDKVLKGNKKWFSPVAALITIGIAAGIFMVQYKPTQAMVEHTVRGDSSYEFVTQGSLSTKQIFTAFIPKLFGDVNGNSDMKVPYYLQGVGIHNYWETSFYFGIAILALGLFGAFANFKRRDIQLMLILAIFGTLFALGKNFFIFDIFYNLPFFGLFRNPARIMFIVSLAFAYMAGIGFDTLYQRDFSTAIKRKFFLSFGIVLFFVILGAFGVYSSVFNTPEDLISGVNNYGMIALLFVALISIISFIALRIKANNLIIGSIIALLVFVDLYSAGGDFNISDENPLEKYASAYNNNQDLKKLLTATPPNDVFRVKMRLYDENGRTLARPMEDNQGMIDNIMLVEGYNPLLLNRIKIPITPASIINDMKNVRYSLEIDSTIMNLAWMKRETAFGPAWFVYNSTTVPTEKLTETSKNNEFNLISGNDFKNTVVLEKNNKLQLSGKKADSVNNNVKITEYSSNLIKYSASSDEDAILCFSEIYYPDWKAYIDGKETEIYAANYGFRAIDFPKGKHNIELKFECESYYSGKNIALLTFLFAIILYFAIFYYENSQKKKSYVPEVLE